MCTLALFVKPADPICIIIRVYAHYYPLAVAFFRPLSMSLSTRLYFALAFSLAFFPFLSTRNENQGQNKMSTENTWASF